MDLMTLPSVVDRIGYLPVSEDRPQYRIHPPASGRPPESPPIEYHERAFYDCRPLVDQLDLDRDGVTFRSATSKTEDCYDNEVVRAEYYPEVERLLAEITGAAIVVAFDHNIRSADGARRQQVGAQPPVDAAHGDYTADSGARRVQQALADRGEPSSEDARTAIVNVWRPLVAVVQDRPLAVCDPRTIAATESRGDDDRAFRRRPHPAATQRSDLLGPVQPGAPVALYVRHALG